MNALQIDLVPCFTDNYVFLVRDPASGAVAVVDPADSGPVIDALEARGWRPTHILNTHHHPDHVGGNADLKARYGVTIVGPAADRDRIPGIDIALGEGDPFTFGTQRVETIDVPGHTRGHCAYHLPDAGVVFVGDTLFALGCGRLFEGTPAQMQRSLAKLAALPDDTLAYCAHEYTQSNARFAVTVEPGNADLAARTDEIDRARAQGIATVPTTIGREKATNPFLRWDSEDLRATLGLEGADAATVLGETRRRKDVFRG